MLLDGFCSLVYGLAMETKPSPFFFVVDELTDSLTSSPIPSANDPEFENYLDRHTLLQQLTVARHYQDALEKNPDDPVAAANLLRSLTLVERSRSRVNRFQANSVSSPRVSQPTDSIKAQPERDDAREFLMSELVPGPRPATDLFTRARALGFSAVTLRRAKASLNIISSLHVTADKTRFWTWALPEHATIAEFDKPIPLVLVATPTSELTDSSNPVS